MPAKRVMLIGDQQRVNWPASLADAFHDLTDIQIVDVAAPKIENTWISDFRLRDGVADSTPRPASSPRSGTKVRNLATTCSLP